MRNFKSEKTSYHCFESYGEFVHTALGDSPMTDGERSSRREGDEWSGGSWDLAKKTAPSGDVPGAAKIRAAIIREANDIRSRVPRLDPVFKSDGGVWIDVSRYLSGEPECWGDMVRQGGERTARHVGLVFNACANSNVKSKDFERVSRIIAGALLGLKSMGIGVSLHVCYANSGDDGTDTTSIDMTTGEGAFDVARLAAVCNTWFFRRIVFSYWETREESYRSAHGVYRHGSYGRSIPVTPADAKAITGRDGSLILNLERMTYQSDDQIRESILAVLKREVTA